jgi:hypothetical protein
MTPAVLYSNPSMRNRALSNPDGGLILGCVAQIEYSAYHQP